MIARLPRHSSRGFILIAVIGVLATMIFLLFAAQGSVTQAYLMGKIDQRRAQVYAATNSALEQIQAQQGDLRPQTILFIEGAVREIRIAYFPIESGDHPIWESLPHLAPVRGDQLARLEYTGRQGIPDTPRYFLINPAGYRRGVVALPAKVVESAIPEAVPAIAADNEAATGEAQPEITEREAVPVPDAAAAGGQ